MSDSVQPHRQQPTRLCHPWDSPGKNTGVGCHFLLQCMKVKSESEVTQSCPTLSDPMDYSPPGSSIHGIFQARGLEWGAILQVNKSAKKFYFQDLILSFLFQSLLICIWNTFSIFLTDTGLVFQQWSGRKVKQYEDLTFLGQYSLEHWSWEMCFQRGVPWLHMFGKCYSL